MLKLLMFPIVRKSCTSNRIGPGILLLIFSFTLPNILFAQEKNPLGSQKLGQEPLNIQSDTAEFDAGKGTATHLGHVSVLQGDRVLSADRLEIKRDSDGKLQMIIAKGNPASFEASPDPQKPKVYGKAKVLHYFPKENKIILMDTAELKQVDKTLQGALITYHFDNQMLVSDSLENQRTTIIIKQED